MSKIRHIVAHVRHEPRLPYARGARALVAAAVWLVTTAPWAFSQQTVSNSLSTRLIAQGYRQLSSGSYASAGQTLAAALKIDPTSVLARRYLAHALLRSGQGAKAALQFEQLLKDEHPDAADESALGDAYINSGNPNKALTAYKAALKIDPNLESARGGLIHSYLSLGRTDEAVAMCKEVLGTSKTPETRKYYQSLLDDLMQRRSEPKEEEPAASDQAQKS